MHRLQIYHRPCRVCPFLFQDMVQPELVEQEDFPVAEEEVGGVVEAVRVNPSHLALY